MSKTMRRTPIIFDFGFTIKYDEHDYTNDWARIGVYWSVFNSSKKNILPVYNIQFPGDIMSVYEDKGNDWFVQNYLIERVRIPDSEGDGSVAVIKNTKCVKEIFYDSDLHIRETMHLNLHQEVFDLETWLLENLNGDFRFIATIQLDKVIREKRCYDDDEIGEHFDGIVGLWLNLSIDFDDDLDAMAYKLTWE